MVADIEEAIPGAWWALSGGGPAAWMGAFTPARILIGVRGCSEQVTLLFEVEEGGRLARIQVESPLVTGCVFQRVRIVEALGRHWHVDPSPDAIASGLEWRLWAWQARPLA